LLLVLVDGAGAAHLDQFAEGIAAHWGSESTIDTLDELVPRWDALVVLPAVVPPACRAFEVEGSRGYLEVFRRAVGAEELFSLVEPGERIVGAVIFGVA
jgi:hypothetical protein